MWEGAVRLLAGSKGIEIAAMGSVPFFGMCLGHLS
jgi:hypothetical protein